MHLEGRNFCQNGLTEQYDKGRSGTPEGNQLSSEEGKGCSVHSTGTLGSPAGSQQALGPNYFVHWHHLPFPGLWQTYLGRPCVIWGCEQVS